MHRTVVFIAPSFPHPVSAFLAENGYTVLEAQSAEEAISLSIGHDVDAVIVTGGGDYPGLAELRQRRITVNLSIHATGPDVFFELSHLFSSPSAKLQ
jgi:DNA-binding response OmpR family regulator